MSGSGVVEVVEVTDPGIDVAPHGRCAIDPSLVTQHDGRKFDAADEPDYPGPGQSTGNHPREVGALVEPEDHRGHVAGHPDTRGNDEHGFGVIPGHAFGWILELEPVAKHQVVTLVGVDPQCLLLGARGPGLDVTGVETQRITNPLEALVCAGVPGRVRDGPRGDETDA